MNDEKKALIETLREERVSQHVQAFRDVSIFMLMKKMAKESPEFIQECLSMWDETREDTMGVKEVMETSKTLGLTLPEAAAEEIERTAIEAAREKLVAELLPGEKVDHEEAERDEATGA